MQATSPIVNEIITVSLTQSAKPSGRGKMYGNRQRKEARREYRASSFVSRCLSSSEDWPNLTCSRHRKPPGRP
jgi:hypothetical protein